MTVPFLKSKLYIPPIRSETVPRPHILSRLNDCINHDKGFSQKLTLISAPAGFGKTTVLSEWIKHHKRPTAWITLDEGDNEPTRFLTYLIAALQTVENNFGIDIFSTLHSSREFNVELILTQLLNEVHEMQNDVILVLDDYHQIESENVDKALSFILSHLPRKLHIVIATRSDPSIPLSRMRGRGELNELRSSDLRFSIAETSAFLKNVLNVDIEYEQVKVLNTRTEGWIAGLQMAALSMRGVNNIDDFISAFAGNHRYVVDYLVDEVLEHCSPNLREFLLKTSILDSLSASLCNSITGRTDGQEILERLEQDNIFTIPLDQHREWYRYHHLFSELLLHRLTQMYPEQMEDLHKSASHWLNENGLTHQAIKQALLMRDKRLAGELLEYHIRVFLFKGRIDRRKMMVWFSQLPEDLLRERPLLDVFYVWIRLFNNPFENHDVILQDLVNIEKKVSQPEFDIVLKRTVLGHINSIQALILQPPITEDHDPFMVLALYKKAQELLPASELYKRSSNYIGIAYEYMHLEDVDAAVEANNMAFKEAQRGGNQIVSIVALRNLALIAYHVGDLDRAIQICLDGLSLLEKNHADDSVPILGLEILTITLGYLYTEQAEWTLAEAEFDLANDSMQLYGEYESLVLGCIGMSRMYAMKGEYAKAIQMLDRNAHQWASCRPIAETLQTHLVILRSEEDSEVLSIIQSWLQVEGHEFDENVLFQGISPWAETRHISQLTKIQSQVALFHQKPAAALTRQLHQSLLYMDSRIQSARQHGLIFRAIECLVIKAIILDTLRQRNAAVEAITQALDLSIPKGYRRVFLDKGDSLQQLLYEINVSPERKDFISQLGAAIPPKVKAIPQSFQSLIEPLSPRELEVLELIAQGCTNKDISNKLFLALNTVKGHNRNIFGKLGVKNRTQAVNQARSLGLLPS